MYTTNIDNISFEIKKLKNVSKKDLSFKGRDLLFGYACAAAQIENGLDDIWLDHAKEGKVAGFLEDDKLNIRNNFWDNPDSEMNFVYDTGVDIFRMGLDWQRICPEGLDFDKEAITRYKEILKDVKDNDMKTMVTLYHHSEPKWTHRQGSWKNSEMIDQFVRYSEFVAQELNGYVDYWNTFNEVQMYITLTQLSNFWPSPKGKYNSLGLFNIGPIKGTYQKSMENVAKAHNRAYEAIKKYSSAPVSIAHNLAYYVGDGVIGRISAKMSWQKFNFLLVDLTKDHLDYLGINYYGAEVLKGFNLVLSEKFEYSDSGRAIYPKGLYEMIKIFYEKYKLPIFITENGMSDAKDIIREKYMLEHMKSLDLALSEDLPVLGYIWWSMTDNLEWADGYAPKFGLVEVNRENKEITYKKRKSYYLYKKIVQDRIIDTTSQDTINDNFKNSIGLDRIMTRDRDAETALSTRNQRTQKVKDINWSV